jgi:hypothetical protein
MTKWDSNPKKQQANVEKQFTEGDKWSTRKMLRFLSNREVPIKTALLNCFISITLAKIKRLDAAKCQWGDGNTGNLINHG